MELENKSKAKEKFVLGLAIFAFVIVISVLIVIKINVPAFKLKFFIWSLVFIVLIFTAIILASYYFSFKNKRKSNEKFEQYEKLPKPVTLEQCRDIAKNATINPEYADYINGCLGENTEPYGKGQKSWVYTYHGRGYYKGDDIYVLINMHYPNDKRTILINPKPEELKESKMLLSVSPEPTPDVREIKTYNALSGTEQTVTETTAVKDEKEDKKEEEKSL